MVEDDGVRPKLHVGKKTSKSFEISNLAPWTRKVSDDVMNKGVKECSLDCSFLFFRFFDIIL